MGEQQRVEILTAIYQGADILILDEPTAVLTPQETEVLFETLRHMKEDGKSIILITHKLEEIISIVDEVTVLRDGKLIGTRLAGPDMTKEETCGLTLQSRSGPRGRCASVWRESAPGTTRITRP